MNLAQTTINRIKNMEGTPQQALTFALLNLRGGKCRIATLDQDFREWILTYGQPTYEFLEAWAATQDFESAIAQPLLDTLEKEK